MPRKIEIDPARIEVPASVLAGRLGFKQVGRVPEDFEALLRRSVEMIVDVSIPIALIETPWCRWKDSPVEGVPERDLPEEGSLEVPEMKLEGKLVYRHMRNCEKLTLMLVTLGGNVDRAIEKAHEDEDELLSFFLDGVASEYVEFTARKVDMMLREEFGTRVEEEGRNKGIANEEIHGEERKNRYVAGSRISPGYGDLPLQLNEWIVKALDGEKYGISVNRDSYLLLPRKTISALIGWKQRTR